MTLAAPAADAAATQAARRAAVSAPERHQRTAEVASAARPAAAAADGASGPPTDGRRIEPAAPAAVASPPLVPMAMIRPDRPQPAARDAAPRVDAPSTTASTIPIATELRRAVNAVVAPESKADTIAAAPAAPVPDAATVTTPSPAAPERIAAPAVTQVATPVGASDWGAELRDRVAALVDQNLTHAQIKLSPAHLGPIEIRIALSDGQATIAFTTHSHVTREALEAAAPGLRQVLAGQGFGSVNVDVAQQQFRDRSQQAGRYEPQSPASPSAPKAAGAGVRGAAGPGAIARLDAYA